VSLGSLAIFGWDVSFLMKGYLGFDFNNHRFAEIKRKFADTRLYCLLVCLTEMT
jgi:hypothetical protein